MSEFRILNFGSGACLEFGTWILGFDFGPLRPPGPLWFKVIFSFGVIKIFLSGPSADEEKGMNEEEAESAEIHS